MLDKEKSKDKGGILACVFFYALYFVLFTSHVYRDDMGLGILAYSNLAPPLLIPS